MCVQLLRQRLHRFTIRDELGGKQKALAPDVADEREPLGKRDQLCLEHVAHDGRIVDQPEAIDLVEHRKPGSTGKRVAGIGEAMLETAGVEHRLNQP
ncbi:hypothetical protein D3C72_1665560 [compost metagenome]